MLAPAPPGHRRGRDSPAVSAKTQCGGDLLADDYFQAGDADLPKPPTALMRIAYLTSRLPYPPIGGDRLRAYYFLRHLLRSHEVTLYAIGSPLRGSRDGSCSELAGLEQRLFPLSSVQYGWNALKSLFSSLPLQVKLYETRQLSRALTADVERGRIDLLFVHLLRMAEFARPFSHLFRILDMTDSIHLNYSRMSLKRLSPLWLAAQMDRERLARYEAVVPGWFDKILITSAVDQDWVQKRSGHTNFVLVPQGVDLENFPMPCQPAKTKRIVFFGKLDTLPNADAAVYFAREVFPLVKQSVPEAEFLVVGWDPPQAVRGLARSPGVAVRANVPDVQPEVAQSAVSVAPMRFGAGMQTKIVESLALGVPVVASAEAGLAFGDLGQGPILVGRTAEELAEHVVHVLSDDAFRERLRRAGRSLVESKYSWEQVLAPLDRILEEFQAQSVAT